MRSLSIDVGDRRHFALRDSRGDGRPLLLLHGIPGHGGAWDKVVGRLAPGYRALVPDLLGFGESARPKSATELHAEAQADGLVTMLDRLGIDEVAVVGHDFGGPVALWMTRLRPGLVTQLGIVSANVMPDAPIPPPLGLLRARLIGGVVERVLMSPVSLRLMIARGVGTPRPAIDRRAYVGDRDQARAIRTIFATSLRNLAELYAPTKQALEQIDVPTLVVWGDHDPFFSVDEGRRIALATSRASFELLEGAGHFLPEERPEELARLIGELVAAG